MRIVSRRLLFGIFCLCLFLAGSGHAFAASYGSDFEGFALGEVNGQEGWTSGHGSSFCPLYDVAVVPNTYGLPSLGTKSLRISNAITCGSFNDQTFSPSLPDEAGETAADTSAYSGGTRQPYFEAQWDFASTVPGAEQPGLSVVASPDRGDPGRMSWIQMQDTPTGLQVNFEDYHHDILDFVVTPVATGLDRTVAHTLKVTVNFADGAGNDIVKIYIDGALVHTGTTWEDYFRDYEIGIPHPVDSMLFRVAGTAAPANSGKGFLIDNFSSYSGPVPSTLHVIKHVINDNGKTETASAFNVHVKQGGTDVTGSPASGQESPGTTYSLPAGTYVVSEDADASYASSYGGDCDSAGSVTLAPGDDKTCVVTNDDVSASSGGLHHGTIVIIKRVINDDGGTKTASDFPLFVNATPVVSGASNDFPAPAGVYVVTEASDAGYAASFSGDCDADGRLNLNPGDVRTCIITNDDVAAVVSPVNVGIRVTKAPSLANLPVGGGTVTYDEEVVNTGSVALSDISLTDDACEPVVYVSGDTNADSKLDVAETWKYVCSTELVRTTTNTATARGASGGFVARSSATATVHVEVAADVPSTAYGAADALASAPTIDADKGLVAPPLGAATHCAPGTLMKLADDGNQDTQSDTTVYACGIDGNRYVFPDPGTYFSWFKDFSGVRIVDAVTLASLPLAGNVTYRPGSRLLKIGSDPKTYAVAKGGVLRWVTSEEVARALYGAGWNRMVSDIPVAFFGDYVIGAPITLADAVPGPASSVTSACAAPSSFTAPLAFGSADPQVLSLQRLLQCLGDLPADAALTGYFGTTTQDAVKAFQKANAIEPVGSVGPLTRSALNRYVAP